MRKFFGGRRQQDCPSRFSVHLFRRVFLNRMAGISPAAGRPLSASLPNRAKSGIRARFPLVLRILLRKTPPKTKHGKSGIGNPAAAAPPKELSHGLGKKGRTVYIFLLAGGMRRDGRRGGAFHSFLPLDIKKYNAIPYCSFSLYPAWAGVFLGGGSRGIAHPGFSVLRFRRSFS